MTYYNHKGVLQMALNQANPEEIINAEEDLNLQSTREFVVGNDSVFDGAKLVVYKFLSANTGWTPFVDPSNGQKIEIDNPGAGYGIDFFYKKGEIKFVIENPTANTDVKIDLIK